VWVAVTGLSGAGFAASFCFPNNLHHSASAQHELNFNAFYFPCQQPINAFYFTPG
jgi:hypothetical protein